MTLPSSSCGEPYAHTKKLPSFISDDSSLPSYSETRIRIFENIHPSTPSISEANEPHDSPVPCARDESPHATEEGRSLLTGSEDKCTDVQKAEGPAVSSESTPEEGTSIEEPVLAVTIQGDNMNTSHSDEVNNITT